MEVWKTNKEQEYLVLVSAYGPYPSAKGLKEVFDLMDYSSNERSEILKLFDKVKTIYDEDTKKSFFIFGAQFSFKLFLLLIVIYAGSFVTLNALDSPMLYFVIVPLIISIVMIISLPKLRPINNRVLWKRAVNKVSSDKNLPMNDEQLKAFYRDACESFVLPLDYLQITTGIIWDETISTEERLKKIEQKEVYRDASESIILPVEYLRIISSVLWDETATPDERLKHVKLLLKSLKTT